MAPKNFGAKCNENTEGISYFNNFKARIALESSS